MKLSGLFFKFRNKSLTLLLFGPDGSTLSVLASLSADPTTDCSVAGSFSTKNGDCYSSSHDYHDSRSFHSYLSCSHESILRGPVVAICRFL